MKLYQSPLVIGSAILISLGAYFAFETVMNPQSWGLLIGIPALIIGGIGLMLHFIIDRFIKLANKNKMLIEILVILAAIICFIFYT